jgi:hypothetical protein
LFIFGNSSETSWTRNHFRRKYAHIPNCATPRNRPYYYSMVAKVCQYIFWRNHNLPQKLRTICGFTVFARCCKHQ